MDFEIGIYEAERFLVNECRLCLTCVSEDTIVDGFIKVALCLYQMVLNRSRYVMSTMNCTSRTV